MNKIISMNLAIGLLLATNSAVALTTKQVIALTEALSVASGGIAYLIANPFPFCPEERAYVDETTQVRASEADLPGWSAYKGKAQRVKGYAKLDCPFGLHKDTEEYFWKRLHIKNGFKKPLCVGATTFAFSNMLFGWALAKLTPTSRYAWAKEKLAGYEKKYLFNQPITSENLAQVLQESGCEAHELSLVSAFLELQQYDNGLTYITNELNKAIHDEGNSSLTRKMKMLIDTANEHLKRLRAGEAVVKNQPQWLEQWNIHQQRVLAREKMMHDAVQSHIVWHV